MLFIIATYAMAFLYEAYNSFLVTVVDLHGFGDQFKPTINCIKFFEEVINFIASVFAHSDLQYDTGYGEQMVRVGVASTEAI